MKHRRAHAAPLAKPSARLTIRDRNQVFFLLPPAKLPTDRPLVFYLAVTDEIGAKPKP